MIAGAVVAVYRRLLGATFTVAVTAGDLVLSVDAVEDFDEAGGSLVFPDGAVAAYVKADPDALTITLAAPAPAPWSVEEAVRPDPPGVVYEADVSLADDSSDAVVATVPHYLVPLLGEGIPDPADPRAVMLEERAPGSLVVVDVLNRDPVVIGSYVDAEGLVPPPTDGTTPPGSPTPGVQSAIGAIVLTWTGVTNDDPVTYEAHIQVVAAHDGRSEEPRAIDSTYVGEVQGTTYWIRALPDGTPLDPGITYEVWIIARDDDGEAPPSAHVQASPALVTSPDIAADSILADHIAAGAITAEKLSAMLILANEIIAGAPASQHVTMNPSGLFLYGPDQSPLIVLPTDPAQDAWFRGTVEAITLDVLEGLIMRGAGNSMGPGSVLTLRTTQGAPLNPPAVSYGWERSPIAGEGYQRLEWSPSTSSWLVGQWILPDEGAYQFRVIELATNMSVLREIVPPTTGFLRGIASPAASIYVLHEVDERMYLSKYDAASGIKWATTDVTSLITRATWGPVWGCVGALRPSSGTVLLGDADPATFSQSAATMTPRVRTITMSNAGVVAVTKTVLCSGRTLQALNPPIALVGAEGNYWIACDNDPNFGTAIPWSATDGSKVSNQDFPWPAPPAGLCHDGTVFHSLVGSELVHHTNWNWTTEPAKYWVGQTWWEDVFTAAAQRPARRRRKGA